MCGCFSVTVSLRFLKFLLEYVYGCEGINKKGRRAVRGKFCMEKATLHLGLEDAHCNDNGKHLEFEVHVEITGCIEYCHLSQSSLIVC